MYHTNARSKLYLQTYYSGTYLVTFVCDDQFPYMHSISRKITPKIEGGFVVMREIIGQFNFT